MFSVLLFYSVSVLFPYFSDPHTSTLAREIFIEAGPQQYTHCLYPSPLLLEG